MTTVDDPHAGRETPEPISRDFDIIRYLTEEVDKSGELYLKVALWKVLLRLPQHFADLAVDIAHPEVAERMKQTYVRLMAQSEDLIREGEAEGGLDARKHGISEKDVRANIQWLREKFLQLELEPQLHPARKTAILSVFE